MTALEWILTVCGSLAVLGIGAITAIAWNLKGSFESFKGQMDARMQAMDIRMDDRINGLREVVELQVGHLGKSIEAIGQFETRMASVEQTATVFHEAFADYKPWRAKVDEKIEGIGRRVDRIENRQEAR